MTRRKAEPTNPIMKGLSVYAKMVRLMTASATPLPVSTPAAGVETLLPMIEKSQ